MDGNSWNGFWKDLMMTENCEKRSKNYRSIDMYIRLCEGKTINKSIEASRFDVDERSIQRDIDDIRAYLDEKSLESGDNREIVYDRTKKGFILVGQEPSMMTNSEILAVSKILLDSRAFTKKELNTIIDKLVEGCVPLKNMKIVSDLIANEKFHYVELNRKEYIKDKLWEIGDSIHGHNIVSIKYARGTAPRESIKRIIEPLAILFSEYYFYLNAYIVEKDASGKYCHKYDYPAVFRIDRIKGYTPLDETFSVPYANRFEEGEFRKRVQFMYPGNLQRISLKYINKKVKNLSKEKGKKLGEISVRDTEISIYGDPRRLVNAIGMLIYHERGFVDCLYFVN